MGDFDLKESRSRLVAKDNRMIQQGLFSMNIMENKAIQYVISKIKPDDEPGETYIFNCREFQALLKWQTSGDSYGRTKIMLQNLGDMSWWIDSENGTESLARWFNIVRMDPNTGDIAIKFHEDTFPYLCKLQEQREKGGYFTAYKLQNITLMKHTYSPRIYELLKSYQYNNQKWTFENGTGTEYDFQRRIADTGIDRKNRKSKPDIPKFWANWSVFKRDVLEPAVKEINLYTDIKVAYVGKKEDIHHKKTKAIRTIEFYMIGKTEPEQRRTEEFIDAEYREIEESNRFHQMTLEETFFKAHEKSLEEERAEKAMAEEERIIEQAGKSEYPVLSEILAMRGADFDEDKIAMLYHTVMMDNRMLHVSSTAWELVATDIIVYYYDKIKATPEETKTTPFKRLLDMVRNDYDGIAERCRRAHGERE